MYTDLLQTEHTTVHKPFKTFSLNSHNIPNSYYGCYQRWPPPQCITLQLFIPSVVPSLRVMTQLILCLAFDYKHISSSDAALLLKLAHKKTHRVYLSLLGLALGEASSCAVHLAWDQHLGCLVEESHLDLIHSRSRIWPTRPQDIEHKILEVRAKPGRVLVLLPGTSWATWVLWDDKLENNDLSKASSWLLNQGPEP